MGLPILRAFTIAQGGRRMNARSAPRRFFASALICLLVVAGVQTGAQAERAGRRPCAGQSRPGLSGSSGPWRRPNLLRPCSRGAWRWTRPAIRTSPTAATRSTTPGTTARPGTSRPWTLSGGVGAVRLAGAGRRGPAPHHLRRRPAPGPQVCPLDRDRLGHPGRGSRREDHAEHVAGAGCGRRWPHVSYFSDNGADLKYARWTGSAWAIQTVDTVGRGRAWTAPWRWMPQAGRGSATRSTCRNQLKYAAWNGAAWEIQVVDTAVAGYVNTSLVLDGAWAGPASPTPAGGNADLKYAAWTGSAWALETVDSAGNTGWYSSLVLDGAARRPSATTTRPTARSGWRGARARTWSSETVDTRGRCGPLHVAGAGRRRQPPHQLHGRRRGRSTARLDWTRCADASSVRRGSAGRRLDRGGDRSRRLAGGPPIPGPRHGKPSRSSPISARIPLSNWPAGPGPRGTRRPSSTRSALVSPAPRWPWMRPANRTSATPCWSRVGYARWTGAAWAFQTVEGNPYDVSLALDAAGRPRISYTDFADHAVEYAAWNGSTWAVQDCPDWQRIRLSFSEAGRGGQPTHQLHG